ncbi:MAG: hypothetical protein K2Z81_14560, partial [Cyanobacteria bacterium]|nr:hypothetical protein [Cyanobacteriota bacterium]
KLGDKPGDKPGDDASKKSGPTKPIFESTKLTPKELDFLGDLAKPEALEKVKGDINKFGRDPKEAILEAGKKSDILGLGELHVTPNGLRTLAETLMPDFKKQGFTHLAVEIHHEHQGILDRFAKGDTTAADELKKIYGGAHSDSLSMMAAAAKAGIKLVAVDGHTEKPEGIESRRNDQSDDVDAKELQGRDNQMASRIAKIKETEPNSKILFVVGASHLDANLGGGDTRQSAGNQLKEIGKAKGFNVTTFSSHIADTSLTHFTTPPIAESASRAVSVETGKTEDLKNFPTTASRDKKDVLGKHDHALFFPPDSAVKMLEAEHGPSSSRLLPALDSLKNYMISQGEKGKGVELMNRSLKIEEATFGKDSKQVADRHKELADYSEPKLALEHEQKRLAILEKLQGDKPTPDFINSLSKTMDLQIETGDSAGALKSFDKALKNLGSDKIDQDTKDRFRGETFAASRRFEELGQSDNAIHVLSGMVKFDSKTPDHAALNSERLGKIGKLNEKLNKPLESEKAHKESLEIAREFIKNGGVNDSVLVNARDNLAVFLEQQGRAAEATPLHRENLQHGKNSESEHHSLNMQLRANGRLLDNSMRLNQPENASEHFKATVQLLDKGAGTLGGKEQSQLYERYAKFLETAGKGEDAKVVREQIEKVKKLEERPAKKPVYIESKTRPQ